MCPRSAALSSSQLLRSTPPPNLQCARSQRACLRKESSHVRCTCIYPGVVTSELASTISDPTARERMIGYRMMAIEPDAIGRAILYAVEQPGDVDVNEMIV